jgi:phosphoglycerate dehydrogenase-like enzyme
VDIVYGYLWPDSFPAAERLKWMHSTAAGVGWTQAPAILSHPAIVTNSRIHAAQISEHLFGLLLMLRHGLHEALGHQRQHAWRSPAGPIRTLPGKTLCILGLGTIGRRCAQIGAAMGMRVVGVQRNPRPTDHVEQVLSPGQLTEALAQADVVMNLLPGTAETEKMIAAPQFDAMPDGAYFLNAGRGQTVDTDALLAALRGGRLAAAGLDVVDPEPLPADHPLWDEPNVLITAHYSGVVDDYFDQTEALFLDNLRCFLAGQPMRNVVDKRAGY